VLNNLGAAYLAVDAVSSAEMTWRRAITLHPARADAYVNLAISLSAEERATGARLREAESVATTALELGATDKALHVLANVRQSLGDSEESAVLERRAAALRELSESSCEEAAAVVAGGGARRYVATSVGESIAVGDVRLVALSLAPAVFRVDGLFGDSEATTLDRIAALARERFATSYVTADGASSPERTSRTAWLKTAADPALAAFRDRVAAVCGLTVEEFLPLAEDLQVVWYGPGDEFGLHHDSSAGFAGARRELTLLVYLNDVTEGGDTVFPAAGLAVTPTRGSALLFYNLDEKTGEPDPLAVHAALPVVSGEKLAANFWVRRVV